MSYYGQNQGDPWGSTYTYGDSSYSSPPSFQSSNFQQSPPSFQSSSLQPSPAPAPVQQFSNSNFNQSANQPVSSYHQNKQESNASKCCASICCCLVIIIAAVGIAGFVILSNVEPSPQNWCGNSVDGPASAHLTFPANQIAFNGDKYESFIDPSIAGKDCSLTILNPSNSRISARGNVALSNFACEDAFVEINGQKFCGNEEVDVEINDQFDLIFFGNFATGSSPPGVGSIRIDVYNH